MKKVILLSSLLFVLLVQLPAQTTLQNGKYILDADLMGLYSVVPGKIDNKPTTYYALGKGSIIRFYNTGETSTDIAIIEVIKIEPVSDPKIRAAIEEGTQIGDYIIERELTPLPRQESRIRQNTRDDTESNLLTKTDLAIYKIELKNLLYYSPFGCKR